jgi:hypothetical protein
MNARQRLRIWWLAVRRRVLPWCMHRGCWSPSVVTTLRTGKARRGNICDAHFWVALDALFAEDDEP